MVQGLGVRFQGLGMRMVQEQPVFRAFHRSVWYTMLPGAQSLPKIEPGASKERNRWLKRRTSHLRLYDRIKKQN